MTLDGNKYPISRICPHFLNMIYTLLLWNDDFPHIYLGPQAWKDFNFPGLRA